MRAPALSVLALCGVLPLQGQSENAPAIDAWLTRLPDDVETVVVYDSPVEGSYLIEDDAPNFAVLDPSKLAVIVAWQGLAGLAAPALGEDLWPAAFAEQTLEYGVLAARQFRNHTPSPEGILPLGLIAYEGCGFIALSAPIEEIPILTADGSNALVAEGAQFAAARGGNNRFPLRRAAGGSNVTRV